MKYRLDNIVVRLGLASTRSQAESWIRLGRVRVSGKVHTKPGYFVDEKAEVTLEAPEQYVSRAGLKLASVAERFEVDFRGAVVLDVGSSTGGFTDYALQHNARRVYAVDVGTDQLHPKLRANERVVLHEKTDIRDFVPPEMPDIVVIDVSFISLRAILPHIAKIIVPSTAVLAMVKPQFEADRRQLSGSGVVKNDTIRRQILREFETWVKAYYMVRDKADSSIAGKHGNRERFYRLHKRS